jgi:hypothetical protein
VFNGVLVSSSSTCHMGPYKNWRDLAIYKRNRTKQIDPLSSRFLDGKMLLHTGGRRRAQCPSGHS